MKKSKKDRKSSEAAGQQDSSEPVAGTSDANATEQIIYTSPIAKPMASSKLTKKIRKLIKSGLALNEKTYLRNGLRDVQSSIRKKEKGLVIFAGDVTPVEVMCHLPGVCEELDLPYVYVNSRQVLGSALGLKRGSLMVLLKRHDNYGDLYDQVVQIIESLPPPW
ncbi:H/ACA ribonucleoprotein complex subunit 2-like protein [Cryptotermes secundus]|uniref:H/ACA ribonucleoprotein complex subunit 2-like protein n=1 Tax=Cryptotermes secundus TaxID=105785 RepID=A0A2J7PP58_9NEOP|nr:H/ACA ribonucleoprotein complex subunit 2-like protein [Cryptotermes secundus]PNF18125.1 H/ACA ribonucleoprotein complex subunit 2-like protein [Cryptotermes secundus]